MAGPTNGFPVSGQIGPPKTVEMIPISSAEVASPSAATLQKWWAIFYNGANLYVLNQAGTGLTQLLSPSSTASFAAALAAWAATAPTTLPATAGVLWNDSGVLCIS